MTAVASPTGEASIALRVGRACFPSSSRSRTVMGSRPKRAGHRGGLNPDQVGATMGGKNKGGREVRKPKQAKKPKSAAAGSVVPPAGRRAGQSAK